MSKRNPYENEGIGVGANMAHNGWHGFLKYFFFLGIPLALFMVIALLIAGKAGC